MSDEQDSWFKSAFGLDLGEAVGKIKDEASAVVGAIGDKAGEVAQDVRDAASSGVAGVADAASGIAGAVAKVASGAAGAVAGVAKKVASAASRRVGAEDRLAPRAEQGRFRSAARLGVAARTRRTMCALYRVRSASASTDSAVRRPSTRSRRSSATWVVAKPDGRVDAGGADRAGVQQRCQTQGSSSRRGAVWRWRRRRDSRRRQEGIAAGRPDDAKNLGGTGHPGSGELDLTMRSR